VSDKKRPAVFHSPATYTFVNYLAYALYAPLYIAGPIITFNDFIWQVCMRNPYSSLIIPGAHILKSSSLVRRVSRRG
jgi:D-alanyl-lipoteichoic acid acyltransferase DltB (MBOAT superfamily)